MRNTATGLARAGIARGAGAGLTLPIVHAAKFLLVARQASLYSVAMEMDQITVPSHAADIVAALRQNALFGSFDSATLALIADVSYFRTFSDGAILFHEGDPADAAFLIVDGHVEIQVTVAQGPITLAVLERPHLMGERAMFSKETRAALARARGELSVVELPGAELQEILLHHPGLALAMIRHLGDRLNQMTQPLAWLTSATQALAEDRSTAEVLANLEQAPSEIATVARAFRHMATALKDQQSKRADLETAQRIQTSILPKPWPDRDASLDIAATYCAAKMVGGDFYDYYELDDDHVALLVADVSGKGVPAALFMAVARTTLRSLLGSGQTLEQAVINANRMLCEENDAYMFVTCFVGILNKRDGWMSYMNCGHNPPYIRRLTGQIEELKGTGLPMGITCDIPMSTASTRLAPGEFMLLYTDGITEAQDHDYREFGDPRLMELIRSFDGDSALGLVTCTLAAVADFVAGAEQSDDITMVAVRRRG